MEHESRLQGQSPGIYHYLKKKRKRGELMVGYVGHRQVTSLTDSSKLALRHETLSLLYMGKAPHDES
jgi:hypothetical protein